MNKPTNRKPSAHSRKLAPPFEFVQAVCDYFNQQFTAKANRRRSRLSKLIELAPNTLRSNLQHREFVYARTIVAWYLKTKCGWSLANIGYFFNRDHSSIINLMHIYKNEKDLADKGYYSRLMTDWANLQHVINLPPESGDVQTFLQMCQLSYEEMLSETCKVYQHNRSFMKLRRMKEEYTMTLKKAQQLRQAIKNYERESKATATA